ncbi:MAG: hypothetical protein ABJL55_06765 [Roseibium sp.]
MTDPLEPDRYGPTSISFNEQILANKLAGIGFLHLGTIQNDNEILFTEPEFETLILIGSTGAKLWPVFQCSSEFADGLPEPLDRFTMRVLSRIAAELGLKVMFPFEGPPFHPFQQWALKRGGFSQSPLGVLVSEEHGPWVGFRGAFLVPDTKPSKATASRPGPCETCSDKPCLSGCPVSAVSLNNGYDVSKCKGYLRTTPNADCWSGCLARRACPFGREHKQTPENARFHMESFIRLAEG